MAHDCYVEQDRVEIQPSDGWRRFLPGNTARFTCTCGIDTGAAPRQAALAIARQHLRLLGVPV
jgi:hypothetical protein